MARPAKKAPPLAPNEIQAELVRQALAKSISQGKPLTARQARFLKSGTVEKTFTVRMSLEEWNYVHNFVRERGHSMQSLFEAGCNRILRDAGRKPIKGVSGKANQPI